MKVFANLCLFLLIFSMFSCRETPNNKLDTTEELQKQELIVKESDSVDKLNQAAKELNNQLSELDKAIKDLDNN